MINQGFDAYNGWFFLEQFKGAVFEIFDKSNAVVDRIDNRGVATGKDLPAGVYGVREITAPRRYILDGEPFYAEIKVAGDFIKFEEFSYGEELGIDVQKCGNYEVMPGDGIRCDFEKTGNISTFPLEDDLSSKTSHTLDCNRSALKLKSGGHITEFRF